MKISTKYYAIWIFTSWLQAALHSWMLHQDKATNVILISASTQVGRQYYQSFSPTNASFKNLPLPTIHLIGSTIVICFFYVILVLVFANMMSTVTLSYMIVNFKTHGIN
jgi:hypothetical protein